MRKNPRKLLDAATSALTRTKPASQPTFTGYVGGNMMPMPKPFLVHIRGAQLPFDPNLAEYWHLQQKLRRAK